MRGLAMMMQKPHPSESCLATKNINGNCSKEPKHEETNRGELIRRELDRSNFNLTGAGVSYQNTDTQQDRECTYVDRDEHGKGANPDDAQSLGCVRGDSLPETETKGHAKK